MSQAKELVNKIIELRSKGNEVIKITTKTKLCLKGVDVDKINNDAIADSPELINQIKAAGAELGINV